MCFESKEAWEAVASGNCELAADILIGLCGGSSIGVYTEKQLSRKIRDEDKQIPNVPEEQAPSSVGAYIFERSALQFIRSARLNRTESIACAMMFAGFKLCDIAGRLHIHRNKVARIKKRLRSALISLQYLDQYYGLWEVYWQEVNRHIYRKPRMEWD